MAGLCAGQHHRVLRAAHGFIGHDAGAVAQRGGQGLEGFDVPLGHGLFNQRDTRFNELRQVAAGGVAVPSLVNVHGQGGFAFQTTGNLAHHRHVLRRGAGTNFHFENAVALLFEAQLGFFQVLGHIATGQCPSQGQALVAFAAQQLVGGQAEAARDGIDQRHFDRTLGKSVSFAESVHAGQGTAKAATVLADQGRGEVVVDGVLDAFGGFFVPRRAANGGRFAKTRGTVGQPQLHDDGALAADGTKRQLVRTNGWNIQNSRFNALNRETTRHGKQPLCR